MSKPNPTSNPSHEQIKRGIDRTSERIARHSGERVDTVRRRMEKLQRENERKRADK